MKRPINPCDWFLLMFDEGMRREGLPGNTCVMHLKMGDPPSEEALHDAARELARRHPRIVSRLVMPRGRGLPVWNAATDGTVPVEEAPDPGTVFNVPVDPRKDPPFRFYRLPDGVAVLWHHALMDARGCRLLLTGADSDVPPGSEYETDLRRHGWWSRVRMAFGMRNRLRRLGSRRPALFHGPESRSPAGLNVLPFRFDRKESEIIRRHAAERCGPFQTGLYLLAAVFRALDEFVGEPGPLVIPVPLDLRKKDRSPVTANYLTFLHFVVERDRTGDLAELARELRIRNMELLREKDDVRMISLLHLGRRLSLSRYLKESRMPAGREHVSCYFSYPGEMHLPEFLGRPVRETACFPGVPASPGIGVFFGESDGCLGMNVVHVRGRVEEAKARAFADRIGELL